MAGHVVRERCDRPCICHPDSRSEESYAYSLFPESHWDIADVVVILSEKEKDVPTSVGQTYTRKNHFFHTRLKHIDEKLSLCKTYIQEKNFPLFGELIEQEALELHAIMMTTTPYLLYLFPETNKDNKKMERWRIACLLYSQYGTKYASYL